jgi:hypothetical protein
MVDSVESQVEVEFNVIWIQANMQLFTQRLHELHHQYLGWKMSQDTSRPGFIVYKYENPSYDVSNSGLS